MFTDGPVTPMHVEALIELFQSLEKQKIQRDTLYRILQPVYISKKNDQSKQAVQSATELGLLTEKNKYLYLTEHVTRSQSIRQAVLESIDEYILSRMDVEPYFALFYSYMLGLPATAVDKSNEEWVTAFVCDVFKNQRQSNPFNSEKLSGLRRWFTYAGLGWDDPAGVFQCNPYERLLRALPAIFSAKKKLEDSAFMETMAKHCPELDGGEIFLKANPSFSEGSKICTVGLSHALVDLHLTERIRLYCSRDSGGWSIKEALPPNDGKTLLSYRIDHIELCKGGE